MAESKIHPGAALFSEEARRAVADGPLFDKGSSVKKRMDGCCVVGALLKHDYPSVWTYQDAFVPNDRVLMACVGTDTCGDDRSLVNFMHRNDRGDYADRTNLRRDLLGEE